MKYFDFWEKVNLSSSVSRPIRLDEKTVGKIVTLFAKMGKKMKPREDYGDLYWEFWFTAPIEDLKDVVKEIETDEDLDDEDKADSIDYVKDIYEEITVPTWYHFTGKMIKNRCDDPNKRANGVFYGVFVNNCYLLSVNDCNENGWDMDLSDTVDLLDELISPVLDKLADGTYKAWVEENMPYVYRTGKIQRKKYAQFNPSVDYRHYFTDSEVMELKQYLNNANSNQISLNHPRYGLKKIEKLNFWDTMTVGDYYHCCEICYKGAQYEFKPDETSGIPISKQMYNKFADGRDDGLGELPVNDSKAFHEWLMDNSKFGGHPHEIVTSMSLSLSIHLYPYYIEGLGYYLMLTAGAECRIVEALKMYLALKHAGVPVVLQSFDTIFQRLLGEDYLDVLPSVGRRFSLAKKNIYLVDEPRAEEIIPLVEWVLPDGR